MSTGRNATKLAKIIVRQIKETVTHSIIANFDYCRPNVMQAAQEMQRNNPELFASMQQQAAQFAAGGGGGGGPQPQQPGQGQQQQGPTDSSSTSDSKSSKQDKKQ